MPIVQAGSLNTTALVVPDLYVQIVPPQNLVLNGVPTNVLGVVGSGSWGPANQAVIVATMADYARAFGPIQPRRFDMGTQVATAVQQGAQSFRCVRVTDGTDLAASYAVFYAAGQYPLLLTARYTGSLGNSIGITIGAGSAAGTWRLTLGLAGQVAESFDNLAAPSPAVFWQNLATAVNQGLGALRGPSQLCVASLGAASGTVPAGLSAQALLGERTGRLAFRRRSWSGRMGCLGRACTRYAGSFAASWCWRTWTMRRRGRRRPVLRCRRGCT